MSEGLGDARRATSRLFISAQEKSRGVAKWESRAASLGMWSPIIPCGERTSPRGIFSRRSCWHLAAVKSPSKEQSLFDKEVPAAALRRRRQRRKKKPTFEFRAARVPSSPRTAVGR